MKKHDVLFLAIFVNIMLLAGCNSYHSGIVTLDIDKALNQSSELTLNSIATSVSYINLETKSDLMIDDQSICNLYVLDDGVLVADKNGCYYFNSKGAFIRQIGRKGRGPGEYSMINNMRYDKKTSLIYISHRSGKGILKYDINGNYIETIIPGNFASSWAIDNNNVLLSVENYRGNNPYMMVVLNPQGDTLKTFKNNDKFAYEGGAVLSLNNQAIFYEFDNELSYCRAFNDTLYRVTLDSLLTPSYVFNTLSHSIDTKTRADASLYVNSQEDFIFPWTIVETSKYLFTNMLRNGKGLWPFTLNKENGEFYAVSKAEANRGYTNDIDGCLSFFPDYAIDNNRVCSILSSYRIIEFDEKNTNKLQQLLGIKITEQSNPVLMIVTLK